MKNFMGFKTYIIMYNCIDINYLFIIFYVSLVYYVTEKEIKKFFAAMVTYVYT